MGKLKLIIFLLTTCICFSCSTTKSLHNVDRDGSSFEKAIIVKSVSEEYEYIRKVLPDSQLVLQSLVFKKKKPYDIITVQKPNGEEVEYYFDISKFYGKMFK